MLKHWCMGHYQPGTHASECSESKNGSAYNMISFMATIVVSSSCLTAPAFFEGSIRGTIDCSAVASPSGAGITRVITLANLVQLGTGPVGPRGTLFRVCPCDTLVGVCGADLPVRAAPGEATKSWCSRCSARLASLRVLSQAPEASAFAAREVRSAASCRSRSHSCAPEVASAFAACCTDTPAVCVVPWHSPLSDGLQLGGRPPRPGPPGQEARMLWPQVVPVPPGGPNLAQSRTSGSRLTPLVKRVLERRRSGSTKAVSPCPWPMQEHLKVQPRGMLVSAPEAVAVLHD